MTACLLDLLADYTDHEFHATGNVTISYRADCGHVIIEEYWPHLRIVGVWRHPTYRGQAYGRNMVEAVLAYCRAEGLQPIACNVVRDYMTFWESLDFVPDPHNPCDFILAGYAEAA